MPKNGSSPKAPNPVFEIVMDTNVSIRGELFPAAAPETVGNFIQLANTGFYDGLCFHRCIPGFIIQGGKPPEELPYCIRGEFEFRGDKRNRLPHQYGSLCMSRAGHYDSASSQFYIVVTQEQRELNCLNGAYAVFGRVSEGMKTAEAIAQVKTDAQSAPLQPQIIRRIRVETFQQDYPFEKLPPPEGKANVAAIRHRRPHSPSESPKTSK